jgi:hypothetical protein
MAANPPAAAVEIPPLLVSLSDVLVAVGALADDDTPADSVGGRAPVADWVIPDGAAELETGSDVLLADFEDEVFE